MTRVNSITQAAAAARNHDAAITMRFATSLGKPACIYTHNIHAAMTLRSATTDSETPYYNYARMNNRTLQTPWRNPSHTSKRRQPQPPQTRAALHCRLQPLFPKKHNVSFSGFLPNTSQVPCNILAAIAMRFATARAHSFSTSPLLSVTTSLSHHASSPPFVITLRHHLSSSLPSITTLRCYFYVMYCSMMYCCVM